MRLGQCSGASRDVSCANEGSMGQEAWDRRDVDRTPSGRYWAAPSRISRFSSGNPVTGQSGDGRDVSASL
jgi:hypothetical protein